MKGTEDQESDLVGEILKKWDKEPNAKHLPLAEADNFLLLTKLLCKTPEKEERLYIINLSRIISNLNLKELLNNKEFDDAINKISNVRLRSIKYLLPCVREYLGKKFGFTSYFGHIEPIINEETDAEVDKHTIHDLISIKTKLNEDQF